MTFRHLSIYRKVCETGNVTKTAKELYISQPAVSLAIAEMESYYQTKLFERISMRLYITEAGKQLLEYAIHITDMVDEMEKKMLDWENTGTLRLGSSLTIGNIIFTDILIKFRERKPEIKVTSTIENSPTLENMIISNKLDFAIIDSLPKLPHINNILLYNDTLVAVCSPDYYHGLEKLEISNFDKVNFLLRESGSVSRDTFDAAMELHQVQITPFIQSASNSALIHAAKAGLGIAIIPSLLLKKINNDKKLKTISLPEFKFERNYSLIYHQHKLVTPMMQQFLDISSDAFNELTKSAKV